MFQILLKNKTKRTEALVSMLPSTMLWGSPWFLCIEDNACFCCGGRRTLLESNYALVTCSVYGKFFRIVALLGTILDLQCI